MRWWSSASPPPPPLLSLLHPAPAGKPLPGSPQAWNKARGPGGGGERRRLHRTVAGSTMRNYQLQSARTSSIGKKEGRRQARPTSNSENLRAGGHLEKKPPPSQGEKKKGGGDANGPPGPGGEPCAQTGPRPRGPLPRLLSASGLLPQAGRPVTLMRSRHWDGVRS